jgi:hypothetical protein
MDVGEEQVAVADIRAGKGRDFWRIEPINLQKIADETNRKTLFASHF